MSSAGLIAAKLLPNASPHGAVEQALIGADVGRQSEVEVSIWWPWPSVTRAPPPLSALAYELYQPAPRRRPTYSHKKRYDGRQTWWEFRGLKR